MSVLDAVDEMVFADGNSTDGTIQIIRHIQKKYDKEKKIRLFLNKDCKNLREDYVRLFNWIIKQCRGEYVWFLHPDMICTNPETIRPSIKDALQYYVNMKSIAGENKQFIITSGRSEKWAPIYKRAHGLHYWGYYGSIGEDMYFKDITGDRHVSYKTDPYLPYKIEHTPINLIHYCDTKPYLRRLGRMIACLKNISSDIKNYEVVAADHPRVNFQPQIWGGARFEFSKNTLPEPKIFKKYRDEFERFRRGKK